jgi:phospholipase A-2-activating protein
VPRRRSATQSWEKIGEITGTDNSGTELGKKIFEGKEWDYVFDIDLYGPNAPPVRLPFNRGDDPWMAAQQWLWKHDLDQGFLDQVRRGPPFSLSTPPPLSHSAPLLMRGQVANHIIKNTPGNVCSWASDLRLADDRARLLLTLLGPVLEQVVGPANGNVDPFTSGGAYKPSGGGAGSGGGGGNSDPFTSSGAYRPGAAPSGVPANGGGGFEDPISAKRYRPGNAGAPAPTPPAAAAAAPNYISFDAAKLDAALTKLLEFNSTVGAAQLGDAEIASLTGLVEALKAGGAPSVTAAQLAIFTGGAGGGGLLSWPAKQAFPGLDILRLLLLAPAAAPHVAATQPPLLPRLAALLGPDADKATSLMVLRAFANALYNPKLRATAMAAASSIMDTLATPIETGATGVRLAATSTLVNVASALREGGHADADALQLQALSVFAHALTVDALLQPAEEESLYRVLVALDTIVSMGLVQRETAKELELGAALKALALPATAAGKVTELLKKLVGVLG